MSPASLPRVAYMWVWMWMMQALHKAGKAKNTADKSVDIISTTMITVDNILQQIGEWCDCILFNNKQCYVVIFA